VSRTKKRDFPKVIYNDIGEERKNSILRYIGNRVLVNNLNFLCALTGATGKGKSWCALSIAEIYSKMFNIPFDPEVHVIHSVKQMLELITRKDINQLIRTGTILVFEELQVEGNARDWHSDRNRSLNRIISTFRDQRLIVLFTTPIMRFIDKQSRLLFHGEFEVEGFNRTTQITTVRPRFLEPKKHVDDFYRFMLRIVYKVEGKEKMQVSSLNTWLIPKASDNIIQVYEQKKKEFNTALNIQELKRQQLGESKEEGRDRNVDLMKIASAYEKYGDDFIKISEELPHINPSSLERSVLLIKRSLKARERQNL